MGQLRCVMALTAALLGFWRLLTLPVLHPSRSGSKVMLVGNRSEDLARIAHQAYTTANIDKSHSAAHTEET